MVVHYYGIIGCSYEVAAERPALRAPLGVPQEYLMRSGFVQQTDGSWLHFLSDEENAYILTCDPNLPVTFQYAAPPPQTGMTPEEKQRANILCVISAALMLISGLMLAVRSGNLSQLAKIPAIAAWVLAIIVRVKYPHSTFGRVLFIIYIVLFALFVIAMIIGGILLIYACTQCMEQCPD